MLTMVVPDDVRRTLYDRLRQQQPSFLLVIVFLTQAVH